NTPESFWVEDENGVPVQFTPHASFTEYKPKKREALAGTYFYYQGGPYTRKDGTVKQIPAGYYAFASTAPVTPTGDKTKEFNTIYGWSNAIRINDHKPIKTYVKNDAAFIANLQVGDICRVQVSGYDKPVLAVYHESGIVENNNPYAGKWLAKEDLTTAAHKSRWVVIGEQSAAPK
ncbi:hypothetical protein LJC07_05680, partial [Christensenellaceae bacterium OttesenSCG-928-L17]|nr:hypothetical protein [Christensenellaceae bacterium OttesenSCG-928-L17]